MQQLLGFADKTIKLSADKLPFAAVMLLKRICVGFSLSLYPDFFPPFGASVDIFVLTAK